MPKYKKWCSGCVQCPKCDWIYRPHLKDWKWHEKNCVYMESVKKNIINHRKIEKKIFKQYIKDWVFNRK